VTVRRVLIEATIDDDGMAILRGTGAVSPRLDLVHELPDGPWWVVGEGQAVIDGIVGTLEEIGDHNVNGRGTFRCTFEPLVPPAPHTIREALMEHGYGPSFVKLFETLTSIGLDIDGPVPVPTRETDR